MSELFPVEQTTMLSPRLAWLKRHALETERIPGGGCESPETGDYIPLWVCRVVKLHPNFSCYREKEIGGGETEDLACADFAINAGIRLWNEEEGIA